MARDSVLAVARDVGAGPVREPRADLRGTLELASGQRVHLSPRLAGPHQLENAAVAAEMAGAAGALGIRPEHIERGVALASWPGRLEAIERDGRTVLLDAAHNIDGVRALARALGVRALDPERTLLVFGALADKPYASMLGLLAPFASRRFYAPPEGRAPAAPAELASIALGGAHAAPVAALEAALLASKPGDTLLVTGSIYFVGALRAFLLGIDADPVIAL